MASNVTESGITVTLSKNHDNPKNSKIFFNPKMKLSRELALCALCTLDQQWEKPGAVKCLDAFAGTGIAGMQWKQALGSRIEVIINDLDAHAVEAIKQHCTDNGFKEGRTSHSYPTQGALLPREKALHLEFADRDTPGASEVIEVTQNNADVLLHQQQFNFIYVDAFGTPVQHLASVFRNAFHGAVVVLVATDIAALYGKAPDVLRRNYGADTARTDYIREMAARILLAAAVQSAARCSKGLHVLYAVSDAHFVTVAVQIKRGANHANICANNIGSTLHCLLCEEWEALERSSNPPENVYELLPCSCYADNPGKTAILLGPMWTGPIFDKDYISQMKDFAEKRDLSKYCQNFLTTLLEEAECPLLAYTQNKTPVDSSLMSQHIQQQSDSSKVDQNTGNQKVDQSTGNQETEVEQTSENGGKITDNKQEGAEEKGSENGATKKRAGDETVVSSETKKQKTESAAVPPSYVKLDVTESKGYRNCEKSGAPMFYYNLHKRKLHNVDIPKIGKVVKMLHTSDYRAARTHFDTMGIRTDASYAQLKEVITKHCSQPMNEKRRNYVDLLSFVKHN